MKARLLKSYIDTNGVEVQQAIITKFMVIDTLVLNKGCSGWAKQPKPGRTKETPCSFEECLCIREAIEENERRIRDAKQIRSTH